MVSVVATVVLGFLGAAVAAGVARAGPRVTQSVRVTVDQPDEQVGPQIHVVYAVPAGGVDRGWDVDGTLNRWTTTFNDWLDAQTGGVRLRLDTLNGVLDTTFVQLKETDSQIDAMGGAATGFLENEVSTSGLDAPMKVYVVVYEGADNFGFCGNAIGQASVVFLESCNVSDWLSMLIGHEVFHLLGAVNTCAPHYGMYEETDDNTNDLMAFNVPFETTALLDPGHDDYWGPAGDNNIPTICPPSANVANSDYLTSHPFFTVQVGSTDGGEVTLAPNSTSTGTCTSASPCSTFFSAGSSVTLSAIPDDGYHFTQWGGASCPQGDLCTLVINASSDITASFAADPYLLVRIRGAGRVRLSELQETCAKSMCRYQVPYTTLTHLVAIAKKGTHFTGWVGACNGKRAICRLSISTDSTLTATFATNRKRHNR